MEKGTQRDQNQTPEQKQGIGRKVKKLLSATLEGLNARVVEVEASFTRALPAFSIVGLGSSAIQESRDRVKSALLSNGFSFPPLKVTVNLAPSDLKKDGSHFDLSIALLVALKEQPSPMENLFVFGELGLDGRVKDTSTIFPLVLSLAQKGLASEFLVPRESLSKLAAIPGITIYGVDSLSEALEFLKSQGPKEHKTNLNLACESIEIKGEKYYYRLDFPLDFSDVKGQVVAKRAALIAAAGFHNILFEGSPGSGKSMIVKRMRYILPPLSMEDLLEVARILALDGKEPTFEALRPFRAPHHSSTKASIFGGGTMRAQIGEVALANRGLLFFDELPHFPKSVLEALREPLEDNRILVSRVNSKVEYEANFLFAAAQNPCPCGNLLSPVHECRCSEQEIRNYKNRLSDPLLDRIDLYIQMQESDPSDRPTVSSLEMMQSVIRAFRAQKERGQKNLNGKLSEEEIGRFCVLEDEGEELLRVASARLGLSHRSIGKILKVARTIADLEESDKIQKPHLLEAFSYRRR